MAIEKIKLNHFEGGSNLTQGGAKTKGENLAELIGTLQDGVNTNTTGVATNVTGIADREQKTVVGTDPGDAQDLPVVDKLHEIVSVGAESRVLIAPTVGKVQIKVIRFKTDGGNVTIAGTNVLGDEAQTFTFAAAGDTIVLMSDGNVKWILIGGNLAAA